MSTMKVSDFPSNPDDLVFCQYCGELPAEVEIEFENPDGTKTLDVCKRCSAEIHEHGYIEDTGELETDED